MAVVAGIALVLNAGLTIQDGLPLEGSYHHYHFPRMKDFPKNVEVIIMPDVGAWEPVGRGAASG